MVLRRLFISIVAVGLMISPSIASSEALQSRLFAAFQMNEEYGGMGISGRREFAEAALAYWRDFDSRIPRNAPADEEWLRGEMDTTDMARITRALNSEQYALQMLHQRGSDCINLFESLLPQIGQDRTYELYVWLKTTSCWREVGDLGIYLRNAGLSTTGKPDDTFKMQAFSMAFATTYGRIADGVVMAEQLP